MSENSTIAWCDSTWNGWIGCTKVGPGCDFCYAEADFDLRKHRVQWGAGNARSRTSAAYWREPLKWNRQHDKFFAQHGRRRRVFAHSLSDVFDNEVDPQWRADLFTLIHATPHLDWLLLTKRIGNAIEMIDEAVELTHGEGWQSMWTQGEPPENVWLGATVVNQAEADRDIPKLLRIPARVRFLSCEPLLGDIDARAYLRRLPCYCCPGGLHARVDWVIAGGESGPKARPSRPAWFRSLRDQCVAADVAFFFKQYGEWAPYDRGAIDSRSLSAPGALDEPMQRFGKKVAGRLLDGREWSEFPAVQA